MNNIIHNHTGKIALLILSSLLFSGCAAQNAYMYRQKMMQNANAPDEGKREEAHEKIIAEDFPGAIAVYGGMIKKNNSPGGILLAEYAYSLALGGFYDLALTNLDRARYSKYDAGIFFFASQVMGLMGYGDIASELWPSDRRSETPNWIKVDAKRLMEKYASSAAYSTSSDLGAEVAKANTLLSMQCYFQALNAFSGMTAKFPDQCVPFMGLSIALEKTGALDSSYRNLEKAVSLMDKQKVDPAKKQSARAHLNELKAAINGNYVVLPEKTTPGAGGASDKKSAIFLGGGSSSGLLLRYAHVTKTGGENGIGIGLSGSPSVEISLRKVKYNNPQNPRMGMLSGLGLSYSSSGTSFDFYFGSHNKSTKGNGAFEFMMDIGISGDNISMSFILGNTSYYGKR
jgi:tetratricopeptide (TPR) repeat protein